MHATGIMGGHGQRTCEQTLTGERGGLLLYRCGGHLQLQGAVHGDSSREECIGVAARTSALHHHKEPEHDRHTTEL